jgi:sugar/nucleoside kinase (ribokinase family)
MKILGIGNAIVDVICKVDDSFLKNHQLVKSTMKLIDENEFQKLLKSLKIEKTIAGGSVANTMVGLAALSNHVGFVGKINDDELGQKYEESLKIERVKYCYNKKKETLSTGTCLILITPDSERTMCTFLGTAGKISEKDIKEEDVKQSELIFLEGYLWDKGEPQRAFEKALSLSRKK